MKEESVTLPEPVERLVTLMKSNGVNPTDVDWNPEGVSDSVYEFLRYYGVPLT